MIKLIAVDLDGTLLDGENRIDGRNIRALQRALDMGIYVVPATGRCMGVFPQELTGLTGLRYAVTENGALIWDYQGERELRRWGLPRGKAEKILRLAEGERAGAGIRRTGEDSGSKPRYSSTARPTRISAAWRALRLHPSE